MSGEAACQINYSKVTKSSETFRTDKDEVNQAALVLENDSNIDNNNNNNNSSNSFMTCPLLTRCFLMDPLTFQFVFNKIENVDRSKPKLKEEQARHFVVCFT